MRTPEQINAILAYAKEQYDLFVGKETDKLKKGGCNCCEAMSDVGKLSSNINALDMQVDRGVYDMVTDTLATCVIGALGGTEGEVTGVEIRFGYFTTDPNINTNLLPSLAYQFSQEVATDAQTYALDFTNNATNHYLVVEEPEYAPIKTEWSSTPLNGGQIPDSVFRDPVVMASKRYYYSRILVQIEEGKSLITFS